MTQALLTVKDLAITCHEDPLVHELCFNIKKGETLALVGESGSGKTLTSLSLLKLLPEALSISMESKLFFDGEDLRVFPEYLMRQIRGRRIAMIFQEPMLALNPVLTIGQQLDEVLHLHTEVAPEARATRIQSLLESVGLEKPHLLIARYPHQLSGGMRQRVMIAMALATEPDLLIADEPTTALDVTIQAQILELLSELKHQFGLSMLFITHDLGVVRAVADRVALMYQGYLLEEATAEQFFNRVNHPYGQALFNALPEIEKRGQRLPIDVANVAIDGDALCPYLSRCGYKVQRCLRQFPEWQDQEGHRKRCHHIEIPIEQNIRALPEREVKRSRGELLLQFDSLQKRYPLQKQYWRTTRWLDAIDGVSGEIYAGETLAIVGESGSGKTTLAKCLMGLESIDGGQIDWCKTDRRHTQMIFQDPHSAMNPKWTIEDILSEGLNAHKLYMDSSARKAYLIDLLEQVGLEGSALKRYPHAFSGGQKQRIAIARALSVKPKLIICDEPTSALDVSVQAQLLNLLMDLQVEHGVAYLFISHNIGVVSYLADRIMVMQHGRVVEAGEAESIMRKPSEDYTKSLLKSVPKIKINPQDEGTTQLA